MTIEEARDVRSKIEEAADILVRLIAVWRDDHVEDDWLGYVEEGMGRLASALEAPIPHPPVYRVDEHGKRV
jgi:hypothetical protein